MTSAFLLALAAAPLAAASAPAAPDDPIGDLIARAQLTGTQDEAHRWKPGDHMDHDEWSNARFVDYRQHGLRAPPFGYQWREMSGQYVLAAENGLIVAVALVR